jgi:acetolactate synthase-1/2/3 large subunit
LSSQPRDGLATVADVIAGAVAGAGTRVAFGHPGGEVLRVIDALERAGVRFVVTHHEEAAVFMAMGYGEFTGRPGVSVATIGPGAANAVGGVAAAWLERASMIAVTATRGPDGAPRSTHQLLDLNAMFAPISKASITLTAENATESIASAVALADQPRPGPVHLAVSSEVAGAAPIDSREGVARALTPDDRNAAAANLAGLAGRAADLLARARRPAVIVGLGVLDPLRAPSALRLVRALGAPAVATPKAKGIVPEDDPLFGGVLEGAGHERVVDFLRQADLLLCLGVDSVEFARPWRLDAPIIHIDDLPSNDGIVGNGFAGDGYYQPEVEVAGDVPGALEALEAAMEARSSGTSGGGWTHKEIADHRQALQTYLHSGGGGLQSVDAVEALRAALPRSAIATVDVGAHKVLLGQSWASFAPRTYFVANGLSSMGYAVPVAAAIRLAQNGAPDSAAGPDAPVVAFVGDGGLSMYLGELETLVRLEVDLLVVVFADESLELIRLSQVAAGLPEVGTTFTNPDWQALGRAFGIPVHELESVADVPAAVTRAVGARGVRMLVVHIARGSYRL